MTPTSPASCAPVSNFECRAALRAGVAQRTMICVKCPKCENSALLPLELGDILLDRCERCGGIWFDFGELEAVIGVGGSARLDRLESHDEGGGFGGPCPRCDVEMEPVAASKEPARPVPVDRCPSCMGLWLERKRLKDIEDRRLLLTVRELFLGGEHEQLVVSDLNEEDKTKLEEVLDLLRAHPQRTGLLVFLERESSDLESSPCTHGEA